MKKHSKRYREAYAADSAEQYHGLTEALEKLYKMPGAKFDETVELAFNMGLDPKQSDQMVRGTVNLPHGSGKDVRVVVFTDNPDEAKAAGAEHVGMVDLIKRIEEGWMDFDVAVATPVAMKEVRKVARVLGPRGLMPNPKTGTVSNDISAAVKEIKSGRVEFKMDKTANMSVVVGKRSFSAEQIAENTKVAIETINAAKPSGYKGTYIKTMSVSLSMSPSVKLNVKEVTAA